MSRKVFDGATVMVTGASSGIGEALACNLAKRGANIILAARSEDRLVQIAEDLRNEHGIAVHVFPMDLTMPDAPLELFKQIKASGFTIDVLINNAGFGKWAHFLGEDLDTYERMLSLNINALVELTYLCIPEMLARGKGGVINLASTAAFQPLPYQAVYAASKSFVLSFTEALAGEYQQSGVRILALCPGNTATNFMSTANADTTEMSFTTPEDVAEAGLNAFEMGKGYHVHGRANYLTSLVPRILPRNAVIKIVAGMFKNRVKPLPM